MEKKIFILVVVLVLAMSAVGCSDKDEEGSVAVENENVAEAEEVSSESVVGCGEIFNQEDMSYSVIGARIEELDGVNFLVLKMEAYNNSPDNYSFSALLNVGLFDSKGNEADFQPMFPAYEGDLLDGTILGGGNKIIGEIAFDISETESDEYILQIGKMMDLQESIKITSDDINKTYDELFENSGVSSEYSIGDTIEFENVSITFDGVRIEPKNTYSPNYDEEGMGLMVLDMTMVNNSTDSLEFTSVGSLSTIRQVCSADGTALEYEDYSYSARNGVEPRDTKTETFGLYYDESCKDFYLTLNPDMGERENLTIVTFSIE
jgi:hypothetical protein